MPKPKTLGPTKNTKPFRNTQLTTKADNTSIANAASNKLSTANVAAWRLNFAQTTHGSVRLFSPQLNILKALLRVCVSVVSLVSVCVLCATCAFARVSLAL